MEPADAAERVAGAEVASAVTLGRALAENLRHAVEVRDEVVDDLVVALFAGGHVLVEDLPGVGKTTLARALAHSLDLEFARVQCTADLLPADVVGTNVFNQRESRFEFRPGPIFSNVVLVDEINRASPKTQSGLLECMQERRITVDVHTHELARPFLVIATQNPVEYEGTYPLPEAQVDRFMVRLSCGRWPTRPGCSPRRRQPSACARRPPCARMSSRCCAAPATIRGRSWGPHRGPGSCCCGRRRPGPSSPAGTTCCPTMCRRWRRACSRTASCWPPRPSMPMRT